MSARVQLSWTVLIEGNQDIPTVQKTVESALTKSGVAVQGHSMADLSEEYDIIGLDATGKPWEATIRAANESDALAEVPKGVTIAKVEQVSIFALEPAGGS